MQGACIVWVCIPNMVLILPSAEPLNSVHKFDLLNNRSIFLSPTQHCTHGFPLAPTCMTFDTNRKVLFIGTASGELRMWVDSTLAALRSPRPSPSTASDQILEVGAAWEWGGSGLGLRWEWLGNEVGAAWDWGGSGLGTRLGVTWEWGYSALATSLADLTLFPSFSEHLRIRCLHGRCW